MDGLQTAAFAIVMGLGAILIALGAIAEQLKRIAEVMEGSRPPVLPSGGIHDLVAEVRALRLWLRELGDGLKHGGKTMKTEERGE